MVKFIGKLKPFDKVSLVTFNTAAFVDFPLKELGDATEMIRFIREIEPGGGTNIYNGMVLGYEELLKNYEEKKVNRLILLTDGYGETEPKTVVEKSREYNAKGIGISAIGVGYDYNSALLQLLTLETGGLMEHAGLSGDIYEAFEKQLSELIFPVAREAKLTLKYNHKIRFKRLFGFPLRSDKNNIATFDIGSLFMGQNRIALAQFDLENPTREIEEMPVIIELSYFDLAEEKYVSYTQEARLSWTDEDPKLDLFVEQETKKLYAIAILNQSMKVMADAFAEENIPKAKNALERAFEQISELYPNAKDEDVDKLVAQMANYSVALDNFERKKKIEQNK
ncbi:MAG: VWA domain-containing protein [Bacteroidales bacterium]|nr:VWA domain-containing protein [Bacteroidales bacterium]